MFSVALLLLLAAGCVKCEQLTQPASVTVQPGQRLTITCQVSYSVNNVYTAWIRQPAGKGLEWIGMKSNEGTHYKESLKNKFSIDLDSSSNTVTLNGQNVQPEDTAVYYCARRYYSSGAAFDYWGKGTMVTVTSASSSKPTVWPLTQCGSGAGETVTFGCLATGFTPSSVTYAWTKNDAALTDSIQYPPVQKGNAYTGISQIKVPKQDWLSKAVYKCVVTHAAGNGQAVFPPPPPPTPCVQPTLKVSASSEEGQDPSFTCFAKDFSPNNYEMKWLKNGGDIVDKIDEVTTEPKYRLNNESQKLYSTASFLKLPSSEWTNSDEISCRFVGKSASCPVFVNSSAIHPPLPCPDTTTCPEASAEITIIAPSLEDIFLKNKGTVVCKVQENKAQVTKIMWEDERGNEMVSSKLSPVNNNNSKKLFSLSLDITYEEWNQGVRRYCIVEHTDWLEPHKALYERRTGGQFERPSVFMLPPVEHTRKEMVTLTCYVRDFYPQEVYVSWLVDDVEADSTEYEFHTTEPVDNHGTYSAYSQLLLRLDQWQRKDVVYSCAVHHESVSNTTKAIVRSIGYTTFDKTNLVNLNLNIPETCKAQ